MSYWYLLKATCKVRTDAIQLNFALMLYKSSCIKDSVKYNKLTQTLSTSIGSVNVATILAEN